MVLEEKFSIKDHQASSIIVYCIAFTTYLCTQYINVLVFLQKYFALKRTTDLYSFSNFPGTSRVVNKVEKFL